jgi:hypothetical protein
MAPGLSRAKCGTGVEIRIHELQKYSNLEIEGFNIVSSLIKTMPTLRDWNTRAFRFLDKWREFGRVVERSDHLNFQGRTIRFFSYGNSAEKIQHPSER